MCRDKLIAGAFFDPVKVVLIGRVLTKILDPEEFGRVAQIRFVLLNKVLASGLSQVGDAGEVIGVNAMEMLNLE
ncbi:hypothetical protein D3C73_1446640 [compost metagenome]